MDGLPSEAKRVWLKAFWGFDPGGDGYLGFTKPGARARLVKEWQPGDLVLIYGAAAAETARRDRRQALGFLEIEPVEVTDVERMSPLGLQRKIDMGCQDRWTHAVPVRRAWRVERRIEVDHIAPDTHTPNMARVIASQGVLLQPRETAAALELPVRPVNVFGEPPVETNVPEAEMRRLFRPSRGLPPSFGTRESEYTDGEAYLYMHLFDGEVAAFLGRDRNALRGKILVKVGYSNDTARRCVELNAGFPPGAVSQWKALLTSRAFPSATDAKAAEDALKADCAGRCESLGGEFFLGDRTQLEAAFWAATSSTAFHIVAVPRKAGS